MNRSNEEPSEPQRLRRLARLARFAFFAGLALVILLSLLPAEELPATGLWDKANHLAAYAALALAGGLGYRGRRALAVLALGLLLLGAALELAQSLVPGRMASLEDILANAIGVALGIALATALGALLTRVRSS